MSDRDQDFAAFAGRDCQPIFTVVNSAGAPMDLSAVRDIGWNCQLNLDNPDILIAKSKTGGTIRFVTDGTDGKFQVIIAPSDISTLSGFYMHQAWVTDGTGLQTEVATGRMRVGRAPAWTYSGDPTTSQKDQVRYLVGDTNHKDQQAFDAEINFALTQAGSLYAACALVCRAIASKYARDVDSVQNELRTMWSSRQKAYSDQARQFDVKASQNSFATPYAGGISLADKRQQDADPDRIRGQFNIGMDDNYLPVGPAGNEPMLHGSCS